MGDKVDRVGIAHVAGGRQADEGMNLIGVLRLEGQQGQQRLATLRVTDPADGFVLGHPKDKIEHGGNIPQANVLIAELPELGVPRADVEVLVADAVTALE